MTFLWIQHESLHIVAKFRFLALKFIDRWPKTTRRMVAFPKGNCRPSTIAAQSVNDNKTMFTSRKKTTVNIEL